MSDLISRQAAIDALCEEYCNGHHDCKYYPKCENLRVIQKLPSTQPEIIHCRDCKHHIDGFFCQKANHHTSDMDYCASVFEAERREEWMI